MSRPAGYRIVAFGSTAGASAVSGVPSSKQKLRDVSAYVRLQVGQRFMFVEVETLSVQPLCSLCLCGYPFVAIVNHKGTENTEGCTEKTKTVGKIIGKVTRAQALIGFPQRPQNFVPAG